MNTTVEALPWYSCHKRVRAARIEGVTTVIGSNGISTRALVLRLPGSNDKTLPVTGEYMLKHNPQTGGYVVVYEDGYMSYSPAEPFEKGYTSIAEEFRAANPTVRLTGGSDERG